MSTNLPPSGPRGPEGPTSPEGPGSPEGSGSPEGPGEPPAGSPEYLEQGSGAPLPPTPAPTRSLKPVLIGGAAVAGLAVAGGAAWAAMSFFSTGAQPAEALPGETLAYAAVDLDPSGGQKIEAIRTLNKFPAFKDELDLDTDDDLRRRLFEEIQAEDECANLDYANDVASWLGNRAGVAVVDAEPTVVGVLQVTDADAAVDGLERLRNCVANGDASEAAPPDASMGFAVEGEWAIVAETDEIAERVAGDGADGSLADDSDYQTWTERAGDPGILTMYLAAAAGDAMVEHADELFGAADSLALDSMAGDESGDWAATDGSAGVAGVEPGPEESEMLTSYVDGFKGMAATLRFSDGAVEVESAGTFGQQVDMFYNTDRGDDALATLPADTVAALGIGFQDGWLRAMAEQLDEQLGDLLGGEEMTVDELFAELSASTGLDLPADVETLTGESAVLAVGPDFDAEQLMSSADGSDVPVGIKVKGDADGIEDVLDKLRELAGPEADLIGSDAGDGFVAIGPNADYRQALLEDGGLGDSDTFRDVIGEADQAGAIFYLDFDAGDDWLVELSGDDQDAKANLAPLSAVGASTWSEGDVTHAVLRVTTDD